MLAAEEHVHVHGLLVGEGEVLVDDLDTELAGARGVGGLGEVAVDVDLPGGRRVDAGDQLDQGGLAGAVVADQRDDLTAVQGQAEVGDRHDAAELLAHVVEPQRRNVGLGLGGMG